MAQDDGQTTAVADERALLRVVSPFTTAPPPVPHSDPPAPSATRPQRRLAAAGTGAMLPWVVAALREERDRGTLFLFLPVAFGIGAIVYFTLPEEPPVSAILLGLAVLSAFLRLAHERYVLRLVLAAAVAVTVGMLAGKVETLRVATPMLGAEVTTHLTGRVRGIREDERGRYRLTVDVLSTEHPHLRYGPDRIRAFTSRIPAGLAVGDGITGLVRLRPQSGPLRPTGYDFAFQNYFDGIGAAGFFLGAPKKTALAVAPNWPARLSIAIGRLRRALTMRIRDRIGGENGAVAAALITGEKAGISDHVNEALRVSGLAHLLSISGLHMALVAGTIMFVLRAILALFPAFSSRRAVRKQAAAVALAFAAAYLVLSGSGIATERSFVMLSVMLLAVLFDRAAITMRNLAIAALVIMLIAPHEIVGPSFQMSFSATAALIAAYVWWSPRKAERSQEGGRGPGHLVMQGLRLVGAIAATSLIAGLATGIFAAFHFNRFAPLGLVGNVLAVPIFSFLVMPLGILGVIAIPFDLDAYPLRFMGEAIGMVIRIAERVAAASPAGHTGLMPESALVLLSLALIIATLLSTRLRLAAIPIAAFGLLAFRAERPPDIAVSEDARLVAVRIGGAVLAVNTARPNAFTLDDWSRAYRAVYVARPGASADLNVATGAFTCTGDVCAMEEDGGLIVAYARKPEAGPIACAIGDIVVLGYAARNARCAAPSGLVVTARDLALKGALEIRLPRATSGSNADPPDGAKARLSRAVLSFAVSGSTERPWHAQRRYSHAARGIPPYRRRSRS